MSPGERVRTRLRLPDGKLLRQPHRPELLLPKPTRVAGVQTVDVDPVAVLGAAGVFRSGVTREARLPLSPLLPRVARVAPVHVSSTPRARWRFLRYRCTFTRAIHAILLNSLTTPHSTSPSGSNNSTLRLISRNDLASEGTGTLAMPCLSISGVYGHRHNSSTIRTEVPRCPNLRTGYPSRSSAYAPRQGCRTACSTVPGPGSPEVPAACRGSVSRLQRRTWPVPYPATWRPLRSADASPGPASTSVQA